MAQVSARPSRGRIDKRRAILEAALAVFSERGYEQSCVQEIADRAGVAKPTVYNHLNDKATLLRETLQAAAETVRAECVAAVEGLGRSGENLSSALTTAARSLLAICASRHAGALHRLAYAQAGNFPDILDMVQRRTSDEVTDALAGQLAQLALAGQLDLTDATEAAEQLLALLSGPLERQSRLGTRILPGPTLDRIATAAVGTFLRAYTLRH